jgi:hypothetical protein
VASPTLSTPQVSPRFRAVVNDPITLLAAADVDVGHSTGRRHGPEFRIRRKTGRATGRAQSNFSTGRAGRDRVDGPTTVSDAELGQRLPIADAAQPPAKSTRSVAANAAAPVPPNTSTYIPRNSAPNLVVMRIGTSNSGQRDANHPLRAGADHPRSGSRTATGYRRTDRSIETSVPERKEPSNTPSLRRQMGRPLAPTTVCPTETDSGTNLPFGLARNRPRVSVYPLCAVLDRPVGTPGFSPSAELDHAMSHAVGLVAPMFRCLSTCHPEPVQRSRCSETLNVGFTKVARGGLRVAFVVGISRFRGWCRRTRGDIWPRGESLVEWDETVGWWCNCAAPLTRCYRWRRAKARASCRFMAAPSAWACS